MAFLGLWSPGVVVALGAWGIGGGWPEGPATRAGSSRHSPPWWGRWSQDAARDGGATWAERGSARRINRSGLLAWRRSAFRGLPFCRVRLSPGLRALRGFARHDELGEWQVARDIPGRLPGHRSDAGLQRRASRHGTRLQIRWYGREAREISPLHPSA